MSEKCRFCCKSRHTDGAGWLMHFLNLRSRALNVQSSWFLQQRRSLAISAEGQTRKSRLPSATSALPAISDIVQRRTDDSLVSTKPRTGNRSRAVSSRASARTCARGIVRVFTTGAHFDLDASAKKIRRKTGCVSNRQNLVLAR
jgi:hypothetical protein